MASQQSFSPPASARFGSPFAKTAQILIERGYSPLAIAPGSKIPCDELGHLKRGWSRACRCPLTVEEIHILSARPALGVGVATGYGGLIAVDHDHDDLQICTAVTSVLEASLAEKRGRRGRTSFYSDRTGAMQNRKFVGRDGKIILEILATGCQTVLPPIVHPETGKPYVWLTPRTLENTTPQELPIAPADMILRLEEALTPWLPKRPRAPSYVSRGPLRTSLLSEKLEQRQRRYAWTVLDSECRELAGMPPDSGRNAKVYRITCRIGRWVHHSVITRDEFDCAIFQACLRNGLLREDGRGSVLASIDSGLGKSAKDQLTDLGGGAG